MQVSLGALGCRELEVALDELKRLIGLAANAGMGIDTSSAKTVWDRLDEYVVYVPFGDQCSRDTAEANAASDRLRNSLRSVGEAVPEPLRPDYTPPAPSSDNILDPGGPSLIPSWVKYLAIAGVSAYLLSQIVPLAKLFGSKRKLAGYRKRKR